MSTITVPFQEAVSIIKAEYTQNTPYKYAEISSTLTKAFPGINKNQISGLITRLVNNGYFYKHKEPGSRYDYIFRGDLSVDENNKASETLHHSTIENKVKSQIQELADSLNKLKTEITKPDEFLWLQTKIDALYNLAKDE